MKSEEKRVVVTFRSEAYEVATIEQAMALIVTPELGTTTEERWEKETRYLADNINSFLAIRPESCVLDYGCGIGRIAKALIDKFGCRVIGIDTSRSMRQLAPEYVLSERFTIWSPETLDKMIAKGFRADCAICLWVIQHAFDPLDVIGRIDRALAPAGLLYALNSASRCVPTSEGYSDDGFDVRSALSRVFSEENYHLMPATVTTPNLASVSMIEVLRKRAS
jgi:SAM-dependent methyltransferase